MINLFRSAGQYDGSAVFIKALLTHVGAWRKAYAALDVLPDFVQNWDRRAERCEALLKELLTGIGSIVES